MKVTELRIGNFVDLGHKPSHKWEIIDFEVYSDSKNIKPIPLTEEWLKKFGFAKVIGDWHIQSLYYKIKIGRRTIIIAPYEFEDNKPTSNLFMFLQEIDIGCGYNQITDVEYVHQMQGLCFYLTGEELTTK